MRDRVSEYANGSYGPVMTAVFFALGSGVVALGVAVFVAEGPTRWSRLVALVVVAAGGGLFVAGLYPTDPASAPTTTETVHSLSSISASVALISAAVVWSVLRWGRQPRPALGTPGALACLAVIIGVLSIGLHDTVWTGLSQRLLWLTLLAWLLLTASQLDTPDRRSDQGKCVTRLTIDPTEPDPHETLAAPDTGR
jgi:hypothetical protein